MLTKETVSVMSVYINITINARKKHCLSAQYTQVESRNNLNKIFAPKNNNNIYNINEVSYII